MLAPKSLALLLLLRVAAVGADSVVNFHEIQYHPIDEVSEWIELRNQMSIRVDMGDWRLDGGVEFTFPSGTVIEPKGYLLIAASPKGFAGALGPWQGQLSNGGERLRLVDRNGRLMDEMSYGDEAPWPLGADGSGATLAKRWPSMASAEPASWTTSSQAGGTPGAANFAKRETVTKLGGIVISEAMATGEFFIELENRSAKAISLANYELLHTDGTRGNRFGNDTLAPGTFFVAREKDLGFRSEEGEKIFLLGPSGEFLDGVKYKKLGQARRKNDAAWYVPSKLTPGEANVVELNRSIVINEIMYHFPPKYDSPSTPEFDYAENPEEWIELYHRGEEEIDLSTWKVRGGADFEFPAGTKLKPKEFLVLAKNAAALRIKYPELRILGDFKGSLRNGSDTVRIEDSRGNPVNEVRYFDSGRWPIWADGGGSSLELRNPESDNRVPEAWAASDESAKGAWTTINYEGLATEPPRTNYPRLFNEFLMGLLDAGEVLVDDVSVVEDPAGGNLELMQNGAFNDFDPTKNTANKWRILGTHSKSVTMLEPSGGENRVLLLAATGGLEHSYNLASTTFVGNKRFDATKTYRISLRAKWQRGSPQLNTRLYFNKLARTTILPMPEKLGTPGRPNSRFEGNIGPTIHRFEFSPIVPSATDAVTVRAWASDPQSVRSGEVWYRVNNGGWRLVEMGRGTDEAELWEGIIPPQANNAQIQCYVAMTDGNSFTSHYPPLGPNSRAFYKVGAITGKTQETFRLMMTPEDHTFMRRAEHAVSNGRLGATVIVGEDEVYFDVGVRLRSSPYGRPADRAGFNIDFGSMTPFRGVNDSISIDRSVVMPNGNGNGHLKVGLGAGTNEFIINQIGQKAGGIPITYDDVIFIDPPNRAEANVAMLRLARFGPDFLEGQFEDAGEGTAFKYELVYHPTRTIDGKPESLKAAYASVLGVDIKLLNEDKEAYRYNFLISNNRDKDDYRGILQTAKALSSPAGQIDAACREVMDVDGWLRTFALISLIGLADTYNNGLEHNLVIYTKADGKTISMPWDLDHGFYYVPEAPALGIGNTNLAKLIALHGNRRQFYGHLMDIMQRSYNLDYLGPWIDHLNEATNQKWQDKFKTYITKRRNSVTAAIRRAVSELPFEITTNAGADLRVETPSVTITGDGWITMKDIRYEATGEILHPKWTDLDSWMVEVPLRLGENLIKLQPLDYAGQPLTSTSGPTADTITITYAGPADPVGPGDLVISEIFYHPADGQAPANAQADDLEFIEVRNISGRALDLRGMSLSGGVNFALPSDKPLVFEAGQIGLFVRRKSLFQAVNGQALLILGEYGLSNEPDGGPKLSNGGESLKLRNRLGQVVAQASFGDGADWPAEADGQGYSLVYRGGDPKEASSWRASPAKGGSPGKTDGSRFAGWLAAKKATDPQADPDGNGFSHWQEYAFGLEGSGQSTAPVVERVGEKLRVSLDIRAEADDVSTQLEASPDLKTWTAAEARKVGQSASGKRSRHTWELTGDRTTAYVRVLVRLIP